MRGMRQASAPIGSGLSAMARAGLLLFVYIYQGLSAITPSCCRFEPSCSHYAVDALRRHGPLHGSRLTLRRLVRCHPWGGWGYDPVPDRPPACGHAGGHGAARTRTAHS